MVKNIFNAVKIFRASASCSKILKDKRIFHYSEKFRANCVFRASAVCSKILKDKSSNFTPQVK